MPRSLPSPPKTPTFSFSGSSAVSSRARRSARASSSPSAYPSTYSSAVPFSWEQSPGIPKPHPGASPTRSAGGQPALPLPPPIRSFSDLPFPRKNRHFAASPDPFAVAFTLCAKDVDMDLAWDNPPEEPPRRAGAFANRFRRFDFHGSCAGDTMFCLRIRIFCSLNRRFSSRGSFGSRVVYASNNK